MPSEERFHLIRPAISADFWEQTWFESSKWCFFFPSESHPMCCFYQHAKHGEMAIACLWSAILALSVSVGLFSTSLSKQWCRGLCAVFPISAQYWPWPLGAAVTQWQQQVVWLIYKRRRWEYSKTQFPFLAVPPTDSSVTWEGCLLGTCCFYAWQKILKGLHSAVFLQN